MSSPRKKSIKLENDQANEQKRDDDDDDDSEDEDYVPTAAAVELEDENDEEQFSSGSEDAGPKYLVLCFFHSFHLNFLVKFI